MSAHVRLQCGDLMLALHHGLVLEVGDWQGSHRGSTTSWRDRVIPLRVLSRELGLPGSAPRAYVVVEGDDGKPSMLLVDAIQPLVDLDESGFSPVLDDTLLEAGLANEACELPDGGLVIRLSPAITQTH